MRKELKERYDTVKKMEKSSLPPIKFYSLRELLSDLVTYTKLGVDLSQSCTFTQYVNNQKSHEGFGVDVKEAESKFVCTLTMKSLL